MSKKKLAKDALKSFLKTVKKIKSFDLKKTFVEDGKTYSKISIIVKHKKGDVPELTPEKKDKSKKQDKKADKSKSKKKDSKGKAEKKDKSVSKPAKVKVTIAKPQTPKTEAKVVESKTVLEAKPKTVEPKAPTTKIESKPAKIATPVKPTTSVKTPATAAKKVTPATAPKKAPVRKVTRKPTVGDNLKLIEGIGPKIESFLKEDGIDTFEKLSKAIPEDIKKMMVEKGGTRYNANNPATWPEQAALAAKGDMEAFKALKLELKGGKRV